MPPALLDFLKKNAKFAYGGGILGGIFAVNETKNILDADNKFKALLKTVLSFLNVRLALAGIITAVGAGLRTIIRETGSLEAALKRIQQLQIAARILAPFVGGITIARQRVAELAQIASKGPFKFEDILEANKSLTVFTKGAFSSTEAVKQLAQVSIATGNNITDVANAVGVFYDNLASGRPIEQSVESMRQLGIISDSTAKQLNAMAIGGHNLSGVMSELNNALKVTSQQSRGFEDDITTVTAEHEKAVEEFKQKIGAPWSEAEVRNTKNYTAAIRAITPAIAQVMQSFSIVFNGLNTIKSSLIRTAAESKVTSQAIIVLGKGIEVASVAGVAFGAGIAAKITPAILQLLPGLTAMGGRFALVGLAIRGLLLTTVWGVVATGIASVVGMAIKAKQAVHDSDQQFKDWKRTLHDTTGSLIAQARGVETLAEKNAALNAILAQQVKNEEALEELRSKRKTPRQERLEAELAAHPEFTPRSPRGRRIREEIEQERAKVARGGGRSEAQRELEQYRAAVPVRGGARERDLERQARNEQRLESHIERANNRLREQYSELAKMDPVQEQILQNEARRDFLIEQQTMGIEARERIAREGVKTTTDAEAAISRITAQRAEKQTRLQIDRDKFAKEIKIKEGQPGYLTSQQREDRRKEFAEREKAITALQGQEINAGLNVANKRSTAYLQAHLDQIEYAKQAYELEGKLAETKNEDDKQLLSEQLARARTLAGNMVYTAKEGAKEEYRARLELEKQKAREAAEPELGAQLPQLRAGKFIFERETETIAAKASGDIRKAFKLEDLTKFARMFEELKPTFGPEAAAKMAKERTAAEIREEYAKAGNVVGYLQSIGGGGAFPQAGMDLQQRLLDVAKLSEEHLRKLVEGNGEETPQSQGLPAFYFNP